MRPLAYTLLAGFLACNGNKDDTDTDTDVADADTDADADADADSDADADMPTGNMRIIHTAVETGPADVYVDSRPDTPAKQALPPLEGSSFRRVGVGKRTITVVSDGDKIGDPLATVSFNVEEDSRYSVVLYGEPKNLQLLSYEEEVDDLAAGEVRYYLFHAGPQLGPIRVLDVTNKEVLVKSLAYGKGPASAQVDEGSREMGIDLDMDDVAEFTFKVPDVGDQISAPFYFTVDDTEFVMLGVAPTGAEIVQRWPLPDSPMTGDTAPPL